MLALADPSPLLEAQEWITLTGRVLLRVAAALFLAYLLAFGLTLAAASLRDAFRRRRSRSSSRSAAAPLAARRGRQAAERAE